MTFRQCRSKRPPRATFGCSTEAVGSKIYPLASMRSSHNAVVALGPPSDICSPLAVGESLQRCLLRNVS